MDSNERIKFLKLTSCIKCGTSTNSDDTRERYCSQCGAPVLNLCSNYNCGEFLSADAKFCKVCGASSTFKNYGLFDLPSPDDELPF